MKKPGKSPAKIQMIDLKRAGILIMLAVSAVIAAGCGTKMGKNTAATVNGRPIKIESLNRAFHTVSDVQIRPEYRGKVLKAVLDQLIDEELILQEAERLKIHVTDMELKRKVDEIKIDYPGRSLEDMLVKEYILMDEWLASLKRSLLIRKAVEIRVQSTLQADTQGLRKLYEAHKSEFIRPLLVRVDHITCTTKKEAEEALRKIRSGQDFNLVAQKYRTEDEEPFRKMIGWVDPSKLPAEIGRAILKTEPGQVSGVVESKYGYSIFNVIELKKSEPMSFEQVEDNLRYLYMVCRETEILDLWIAELKAKADIKINPLLISLYNHDNEAGE